MYVVAENRVVARNLGACNKVEIVSNPGFLQCYCNVATT